MSKVVVEKLRRFACRSVEAAVVFTIIVAIWIAMFLPVAVYFMPQSTELSPENTTEADEKTQLLSDGGLPNSTHHMPASMQVVGEQSLKVEENNTVMSCQALLQSMVNVSETEYLPSCLENFYCDSTNGGSCKPKCSSWSMFSFSAEIASRTIIGTSTVIGVLTTIVIITLSFTHFRTMLEFPSVLIIYQDIIMSIHGIFTLIGLGDRSLFCSSEDLVESYNNPPSPFCTASGFVSSYIVYPLTIWIAIQVGYTLLAVRAPLYFKRLSNKRRTKHCLHVASLLVGVGALLVPTMLTLALGGFSSFDTVFPPVVCWARDRDHTVYTLLVPMGLMLSIIDTQLVLILHFLLRNRCISKSSSKELKKAEVKVLIICCCYVLLGLATMLGYSMSSVSLSELHHELLDYFECERYGVNASRMCDRSGFERLTNPPMITIAYSLLALYPVITLIYVLRIKRKRRIKQVLPDVTSSL